MNFIKNKHILLFIFLSFLLMIILGYISYKYMSVQAISDDIKLEFEVVGVPVDSKNKEFSIVIPDNDFEEWNMYVWENEIDFSENIINISANSKKDNNNLISIYISKALLDKNIKSILKEYDDAHKDGKYSDRKIFKINNMKVYYYERYNNIDTRRSYQYVFEKNENIYLVERNFRIGEKKNFDKIIRQIVYSIKSLKT